MGNRFFRGELRFTENCWEYSEYELFNLASDQEEKNNLADKNPEKRDAMKSKLHNWLKEIKAPKLELNPDYILK